jgi:hypothetical protein
MAQSSTVLILIHDAHCLVSDFLKILFKKVICVLDIYADTADN